MDTLHDDDDASGLLVVGPGYKGVSVPIDAALAYNLGRRISKFDRIVNDNEIAAKASQCSLDEVA